MSRTAASRADTGNSRECLVLRAPCSTARTNNVPFALKHVRPLNRQQLATPTAGLDRRDDQPLQPDTGTVSRAAGRIE